MICTFKEEIHADGGFTQTVCMRQADIMEINSPRYGLCYQCAYEKLESENAKLSKQIDSMHDAGLGPDYTNKVVRELQAEIAKLKADVAQLTAVTGLCCNNQLTQAKLREAQQ